MAVRMGMLISTFSKVHKSHYHPPLSSFSLPKCKQKVGDSSINMVEDYSDVLLTTANNLF